jgi:K(+)-stimulated pyrophosphate-energized sodium pump
MAADVFETYAVSLIGGVLVGHLTGPGGARSRGWSIPSSSAACPSSPPCSASAGSTSSSRRPRRRWSAAWPLPAWFPRPVQMGHHRHVRRPDRRHGRQDLFPPSALFYCALVGLVMTFLVVWITNYFTSTAHGPVRRIAKASETGHATNIIAGISVGHHATLLPVLAIAASIWICWEPGRPVRHRHRRRLHAQPLRHHHLARRLRPDHRQRRRHRRHVRPARGCAKSPTSWTRWATP